MIGPLCFEPLFKERVWGGRRLETLFRKHLPPSGRIGESWELVDREEAQSVVHSGPLRGATLGELWQTRRELIFGTAVPDTPRFPLLVKILDAQETLSVQVHPPAAIAAELGGEPKTEMWHILSTQGDGLIFAGLKRSVTKQAFADAIGTGNVESCLHRIHAKPGDCIFIPSGRVHAIGAGNLILEVQQNSDTTYRVFDWNRIGLDGKPRSLHVDESLKSIDFSDFEPAPEIPRGEEIVRSEFFAVSRVELNEPRQVSAHDRFAIIFCEKGAVQVGETTLMPGQLVLVPASPTYAIQAEPLPGETPPAFLRVTLP